MPAANTQVERLAIAVHTWEQDHPIEWSSTKLDSANGYRELLLKEALHIRTATERSHFNRDVRVCGCIITGLT